MAAKKEIGQIWKTLTFESFAMHTRDEPNSKELPINQMILLLKLSQSNFQFSLISYLKEVLVI